MDENQRDKFIKSVWQSATREQSLKELFENKLAQIKVTPTEALEILGLSYRTLKGILDGTQKTFDHTALFKLASLLQEPREKIIRLHMDALEEQHPGASATTPEKIKFIKENFPLAILKKDKLIDNINDFPHIESRICARLGLKSIFEYRQPGMDVAFSSGDRFRPQNEAVRAFWIAAAKACLEELDNPNEYDPEGLAEYFPKLRWQSTDEEHGFLNVIRSLYRLGVTVIYQPPLHTLQLRGATFSVNGKPCIVMTNYVGFYSTLWFALTHELLHVVFDWEEIKANSYHLSDGSNPDLSVKEKEAETDKYARQYLFSFDKLQTIAPFMNDARRVREFAMDNHVHESIIYAFQAFDNGGKGRMEWARLRKHDGDIKRCIQSVEYAWSSPLTIDGFIKKKKLEIYN